MFHHSWVRWGKQSPSLALAKTFHVCFLSTATSQFLYLLFVCSILEVCALSFFPIVFCPAMSVLSLLSLKYQCKYYLLREKFLDYIECCVSISLNLEIISWEEVP